MDKVCEVHNYLTSVLQINHCLFLPTGMQEQQQTFYQLTLCKGGKNLTPNTTANVAL